MARGNWRSGTGHGPAEVGSHRKIFDGWIMKKAGAFPCRSSAEIFAKSLEKEMGLITRIVAVKSGFAVYRTLRKGQTRMKE